MASKIKVDNIENQCGGAVVTKCGATTTISGSVVKADDIQAADGGNLINQCGTTITLGASGDTINLASGASQSGFGRTGTVDWDTTAKTASFTAVSGNGYFVNTTSGAVTMTLPSSPSAGDIVGVKDYAQTFNTNSLTIGRNSSPINGGNNFDPIVADQGASILLVYVDGTKGWIPTVDDTSSLEGGTDYMAAIGGTITECGNDRIHTFTGPGTFTVQQVGPLSPGNVDYLVVAGGGGAGGRYWTGGGGAGGFRTSYPTPGGNLPVSAQGYPITVGAGGTGGLNVVGPPGQGVNGGNSIFSTITSAGGGGGGHGYDAAGSNPGSAGGSGGGGGSRGGKTGGAGNTPPVSPSQGNSGGSSTPGDTSGQGGGGGGGGHSQSGQNSPTCGTAGNGGNGTANSITGLSVTRAGGGGGGASSNVGSGGSGGGAAGTQGPGNAGTVNTGGGGGGSGQESIGGAGGSGVVIIRYKFQ